MQSSTSVVTLPSLPILAMIAADRPVAVRRSSLVISLSMKSFHNGLNVMLTEVFSFTVEIVSFGISCEFVEDFVVEVNDS